MEDRTSTACFECGAVGYFHVSMEKVEKLKITPQNILCPTCRARKAAKAFGFDPSELEKPVTLQRVLDVGTVAAQEMLAPDEFVIWGW